jgi:hypothetical protein
MVRPAPTAVDLTGSATWEAHLERPHATRSWPVELHLQCAGSAVRCELRLRLTGQQDPDVTSYLRTADGACWVRESGSTGFVRDQGAGARLLEVLRAATLPGERDHAIAWQHPRLGEVLDQATWVGTGESRSLHVVWHRASDQAELVLHRAPGDAADADLAFTVDDAAAAQAPPVPATAFHTIAPLVHEITLPDVDTRSLVVEFDDHLVLCETSLDNDAGERLLAAIDEHLPGKPVRYVLFGHYHPHYTGGLRPVMARGATVMAPPLGAAYAREIAARPFRSPPDALARSGRQPVIETFIDQRTFRDAANELVAIDIGPDSHHTDEYVVFWLPRQQLLFEGDLGWFPGPAGPRAGGVRARGLVHAIDTRQLPVVKLVQSWPTAGTSTMPLAELRLLMEK